MAVVAGVDAGMQHFGIESRFYCLPGTVYVSVMTAHCLGMLSRHVCSVVFCCCVLCQLSIRYSCREHL